MLGCGSGTGAGVGDGSRGGGLALGIGLSIAVASLPERSKVCQDGMLGVLYLQSKSYMPLKIAKNMAQYKI